MTQRGDWLPYWCGIWVGGYCAPFHLLLLLLFPLISVFREKVGQGSNGRKHLSGFQPFRQSTYQIPYPIRGGQRHQCCSLRPNRILRHRQNPILCARCLVIGIGFGKPIGLCICYKSPLCSTLFPLAQPLWRRGGKSHTRRGRLPLHSRYGGWFLDC